MRKITFILVATICAFCQAQQTSYSFDFTKEKEVRPGISVDVPDGNYKVTIKIGSKKKAGMTTIYGESGRLFIENLPTRKGEIVERTFTINKRNPKISDKESVKIKPREKTKKNWDDQLSFEFSGDAPQVAGLSIEKVEDAITVFLCGNSTVVDQDNEPWASWGQMIPRFFNEKVAIANYAESGESANTFIGAGRLKKALTQMKAGDYIFIEFGHNDQKQKGPGKGAYYSYMTSLKTFIDEAVAKGAHPVLVTPTQRRRFNEQGKIVDTHADYPEAMKWLAAKENISLIDLHSMTRTLFEALGVEDSKKALVHYPANTYPGQTKALEDNTHFNPYGAYQIAKCVIEGIKMNKLPLADNIISDYQGYNPAQPDKVESFHWVQRSFVEIEKPDGN
ncbi:rhamnogalacturonan acetylesterase [Bacteroides sp. 224]|uniref:rhamnogalacturonan acetylesterase n=1 Tax=Bacteroides sp. 224 TaxID=2302936 RepID=UPI0013D60E22|nr:rhamnogalacturonan acetylesterase [Bacteroides sp. 224]NDV65655.1 rhamnogalacturonan acetylesterase [Bacteroides sp. 224]